MRGCVGRCGEPRGFRAKPRPVAVVSYWGYGDLVGDWYSKPSPHPVHNRVKVSREEAVRMWTCDAARALDWEGIGSLAPGSHADLLIVDRDTLSCPIEDLAATKVLKTVLGGEIVHSAP